MSERKPDGGPAFPQTDDTVKWENRGFNMGGMSLRDYFAGQALSGLLASDVYIRELDEASKRLGMTGAEEKHVHPKVVSECAYLIADAMLKARDK